MARIISIYFPFQVGSLSFPRQATDDDAIRASLIQILTTAKGERLMRPDFGCDAFSFVFENDSPAFRIAVEREVRSSISRWEPRVRIDDVRIETDEINEPGQILITIFYTNLLNGEPGSITASGGF